MSAQRVEPASLHIPRPRRSTRRQGPGAHRERRSHELSGLRLAVYDPYPLSPYGRELVFQLAGMDADVRWYTVPDGPDVPDSSVHRVDALNERVRGRSPVPAVVARLVGPLRFAARCLGSRRAVVAWVRDPWDALVFCGLAAIGKPPFVVHHNPRQARARRAGLVGVLERALLRRAVVCVHSEEMAAMAREDFDDVRLVGHPPFAATAADAPPRTPSSRTVVFLGDLRPDKGADLLHEVLLQSGGHFRFQTVGRSRLAAEREQQLAALGISYEAVGGDRPVSDAELMQRLAEATVVVAPYTAPTESGTALMAMAVGTPMLGLARGSLRRVLTAESQADDAAELAAKLRSFLDEPWDTWAVGTEDQYELARRGWAGALTAL